MMHFADTSRGKHYAKDPAVVRLHGRYLMYYSVPPFEDGRPNDGWRTAVAESTDLDHWTRLGDLPVPLPADVRGFCAPSARVLHGKVHLFYQTYGGGKLDAICHAVSDDGLTFVTDDSNPIFRPHGDWTCGRAIDADVIPWHGSLMLYCATRDPDMKIQQLVVASAPLDSDFSRDCWTQRCDASILKPELPWEGECIEAPATCAHNGRLYMFYGGAYNNWPQQIGCAVSDDGITWTRLSDQPVLPNGKPGEWNSSESGHPFAFTDDDGIQHLFFQGNCDHGKSWYLSRRTIRWDGDTPILTLD
ncbi:MAG: family 43 glycosylhydrolase [Oligosphaeraceae bacterium]